MGDGYVAIKMFINIQTNIQKFSRCLKNNLNKERNQNSQKREKHNKNPKKTIKENQK